MPKRETVRARLMPFIGLPCRALLIAFVPFARRSDSLLRRKQLKRVGGRIVDRRLLHIAGDHDGLGDLFFGHPLVSGHFDPHLGARVRAADGGGGDADQQLVLGWDGLIVWVLEEQRSLVHLVLSKLRRTLLQQLHRRFHRSSLPR